MRRQRNGARHRRRRASRRARRGRRDDRRPWHRRDVAYPRAHVVAASRDRRARAGDVGASAGRALAQGLVSEPQPDHRGALDARRSSSRRRSTAARSSRRSTRSSSDRDVAVVPGPIDSPQSQGSNAAAARRRAPDRVDRRRADASPGSRRSRRSELRAWTTRWRCACGTRSAMARASLDELCARSGLPVDAVPDRGHRRWSCAAPSSARSPERFVAAESGRRYFGVLPSPRLRPRSLLRAALRATAISRSRSAATCRSTSTSPRSPAELEIRFDGRRALERRHALSRRRNAVAARRRGRRATARRARDSASRRRRRRGDDRGEPGRRHRLTPRARGARRESTGSRSARSRSTTACSHGCIARTTRRRSIARSSRARGRHREPLARPHFCAARTTSSAPGRPISSARWQLEPDARLAVRAHDRAAHAARPLARARRGHRGARTSATRRSF